MLKLFSNSIQCVFYARYCTSNELYFLNRKTPVSINKGIACRFEIREENKSKGAFLQFEKLIEVRVIGLGPC